MQERLHFHPIHSREALNMVSPIEEANKWNFMAG